MTTNYIRNPCKKTKSHRLERYVLNLTALECQTKQFFILLGSIALVSFTGFYEVSPWSKLLQE